MNGNNPLNQVPCSQMGMTSTPSVYNRDMASTVSPAQTTTPPFNPSSPLSPISPMTPSMPVFPLMQQGPPPVSQIDYIPGYLASLMGKFVRAEFIVGTNSFVDKSGIIVDVGVNYFVLQDINMRTNVMCDLYSVRFVTQY